MRDTEVPLKYSSLVLKIWSKDSLKGQKHSTDTYEGRLSYKIIIVVYGTLLYEETGVVAKIETFWLLHNDSQFLSNNK